LYGATSLVHSTCALAMARCWKAFPLTDLQGKGTFSVNQFGGKPVLVPVLSEDCPACIILQSQQLAEIDRLSKRDREALIRTIDAFVGRAEIADDGAASRRKAG